MKLSLFIPIRVKEIFTRRLDRWIEEKLQLAIQMNEFIHASPEFLSSHVEARTDVPGLVRQLKALGVRVVEEKIDPAAFGEWMKKFPDLVAHYAAHHDVRIEKLLEYYLVCKYLNIRQDDVYIDIAACHSPFAGILQKRGVDAYEQDLVYPAGRRDHKIGGDAASLPVPDRFADRLSLQCAFECFQGDADIHFIREAGRVLKDKGMLGIIPLYLDQEYFVKTGPKYDKRKIKIEKNVKWIWRDDAWTAEPFSRHYSPASFKARVWDHLGGMKGEVLYFTNLDELMKIFDGQKVYCHFMFRAAK